MVVFRGRIRQDMGGFSYGVTVVTNVQALRTICNPLTS